MHKKIIAPKRNLELTKRYIEHENKEEKGEKIR